MKVGILTFSYSSNPGSVLQAYALQETIRSIENVHSCDIINYQKTRADKPIVGKTVFCGPLRQWSPRKIMGWIKRMVAYPIRMNKYEKFFKAYYHGFFPTPYSREQLKTLNDQYDRFVVGSDQVWNLDSISVDETYFLDFVQSSHKKIAYAASFGQSGLPETRAEKEKALIADFRSISVREQSGVDAVRTQVGREAEWVLDPSLLRTKEQWQSMATPPADKDYVLVYLREKSPRMEAFAKQLAEQYGLSVVTVFTHWKQVSGSKRTVPLGPLEWLGYVQNARYVVTNSFHGVCFSVVLEKELYTDLLKGGRADTNPRLLSLLNLFELSDRNIDNVKDLSCLQAIDYKRVGSILDERRAQSLNWLKDALDISQTALGGTAHG